MSRLQLHRPWSRDLDFLAQGPRTAWWSWGLLGLAVGVLIFSAHQQEAWLQEQAQTEAELHQAQGAWRQALAKAPASVAAAAAAAEKLRPARALAEGRRDGMESKAEDTPQAHQQALLHPWPQVLLAVERAVQDVAQQEPEGLALLALTHDHQSTRVRGAELRVEGVARDAQAALHFADALAANPLFADAQLTEHEPLSTPQGSWSLRFQAEAHLWAPGQTRASDAALAASAPSKASGVMPPDRKPDGRREVRP